jgi:hypothetical protein
MALDPERLLWVPGQRTIFLPAPTRHRYLLSPDWLTFEALRVLENNHDMFAALDREYDAQFSTIA